MIVLSSLLADPDGVIELPVDYGRSDLDTAPRRLSRVTTLDGGSVLVHSGFSHGDRTLQIVTEQLDREQVEELNNFHINNSLINLSMFDGFYSAAIKTKSIKGGRASLSVYLKEKLS